MGTMLIQIKDLSRSFLTEELETLALRNATLEIQKGEFVAVMGPSGCGKTTTLRAIAGFEKLSAGEIRLQGQLLASASFHLPPEQRRVGMVFQEYALFPHMSVEDNVAFGLYHWQASDRKGRVPIVVQCLGNEITHQQRIGGWRGTR